jgi:mannose-1-phosphate guanylyltransferase
MNVYVVVMAGGSGTRFWPASRMSRPKQLLPLGGGPESLLAATVARVSELVPPDRTLIVTARVLADATRKELPNIPSENLLFEPAPRNTAPCIGWATRTILARDPDALVAVLPSDQHVADPAGLRATMKHALEVAKVRELATIGIKPTRPDTGFGYIELGDKINETAFDVSRFVEKPDLARAKEYVASGKYLWNSGMFFFRARAMDEAIRAHLPDLARGLDGMHDVEKVFPTLPSISIDYGVVERIPAGRVGVVPGDFGWSDVGSWESAWELGKKDDHGNVLPDGAVAVDAKNNLAQSKKMVALVGVNDLVVVETDDAILVLPRSRAQDVRAVVEALKARNRSDLL